MIRLFEESDIPKAREIHKENGLPENCFPDLVIKDSEGRETPNALFIAKGVYEFKGDPALMVFLRVSSEIYLLVDHAVGTPLERMEWLQELKEWLKQRAWEKGLDQMTCWVPRDIEQSFGKRLLELGFQRSTWQSYTLNVE